MGQNAKPSTWLQLSYLKNAEEYHRAHEPI